MLLNALVEKLKRRSKDNSKGHCHNQVYPFATPNEGERVSVDR